MCRRGADYRGEKVHSSEATESLPPKINSQHIAVIESFNPSRCSEQSFHRQLQVNS